MLHYTEYATYNREHRKLSSLEGTMQKEIVRKVKWHLDHSLDILSQDKRHFASATYDLKRYCDFWERFDQGQLDQQHIVRTEYYLSSHYIEYLQLLNQIRAFQLKVSHINHYLSYLRDTVQEVNVSSRSISTYLRIQGRSFRGMSLTDLQDDLIGQDWVERSSPIPRLLRQGSVKIRISDHLPSDYTKWHRDAGDIDIIIPNLD